MTVLETEVLFLILTHLQRDLMAEAPGQMALIVNCLREAFLMSNIPAQVSQEQNTLPHSHSPSTTILFQARKTLLQLIELQSAGSKPIRKQH